MDRDIGLKGQGGGYHQKTDLFSASLTYTVGESTKFNILGNGTVNSGAGSSQGSLAIDFGKEGGVFFAAAGLQHEQMAAPSELFPPILKLLARGKWQKNWILVTELVRAKTLNVFISKSATASLVLNASGKIIDLTDPKLELSVATRQGTIYECLGAKDSALCFSALRVKESFFSRRKSFEVVRRKAGTDEDFDEADGEDSDVSYDGELDDLFEKITIQAN